MNTIDEIVQYAGKIWLKKIAITDHSQAIIDANNLAFRNFRWSVRHWKNIHNDIEVIIGVEWDILNKAGDCCFDIQWVTSDFLILSCHEIAYETNNWNMENMTEAYLNAIERYHDKIEFIGHPCKKWTAEFIDIKKIVEAANKYHIPIEFNSGYFSRGETNLEKLDIMLNLAEQIYVNTDAHMLNELESKEMAFDYLREKWFIK